VDDCSASPIVFHDLALGMLCSVAQNDAEIELGSNMAIPW